MQSALREKLEKAIEIARERLSTHSEYLNGHETRTRVLVVDELLRGLGWEVTNPEQVLLEHNVNGNFIDYVLVRKGGANIAIVESKSIGQALKKEYRRSASGYAVELGTRYAVLTNGARWEAWELISESPRKENLFIEEHINTGDIPKIASRLMKLHCQELGNDD